ncbi:hypothetical protein [Yersinia frederiksenii]|uniref:hypothetical protein n=1 Tax=Yersinia frederiksenii TaxID=29484 RepID=UPI000BFBC0CF|nr:hypothetical protein [Yersinia frederiksenii]ATM85057.1 hypothetical protein CRN74_02565 [Yersinia frederiksenii]
MTPSEFIHKHIVSALVADGVPDVVARGGADEGVKHYHRLAQASRKGAAFDDCLREARLWVQFNCSKTERKPARKRQSKSQIQLGLV